MSSIASKRRGLGTAEVAALITNNLSAATPQPLGVAAAGVATKSSRDDHVHAHGTIASGDLHTEYQKEAEKGAVNGYAGLDGSSLLVAGQAADKAVYSTGGGQALVPADIGAAIAPANSFTLLGTPPSFAVLQTVPVGNMSGRIVFGTWELANTAANAAKVSAEIETGVGTGVYSEAQRVLLPINAETRPLEAPYSFFVPAGRRYRFGALGLGGTTEVVATYNYVDV